MTPNELAAALKDADAMCAQAGLGQSEYLPLTIIRERCPEGEKMRTPFGLARIMQTQPTPDNRFQCVFYASRKQILAYLNKCFSAGLYSPKEPTQ